MPSLRRLGMYVIPKVLCTLAVMQVATMGQMPTWQDLFEDEALFNGDEPPQSGSTFGEDPSSPRRLSDLWLIRGLMICFTFLIVYIGHKLFTKEQFKASLNLRRAGDSFETAPLEQDGEPLIGKETGDTDPPEAACEVKKVEGIITIESNEEGSISTITAAVATNSTAVDLGDVAEEGNKIASSDDLDAKGVVNNVEEDLQQESALPQTVTAADDVPALSEAVTEVVEIIETSSVVDQHGGINTSATESTAISSEITVGNLGSLGEGKGGEIVTVGASTDIHSSLMMASQLMAGVDYNNMDNIQRIQASGVMLQYAQLNMTANLGTTANQIQDERLQVERKAAARIIAQQAAALAKQRTEDFRNKCSQSIIVGIFIMVGVGGYRTWQRGVFKHLYPLCVKPPAKPAFWESGAWTPSRLEKVYRFTDIVWCYAKGLFSNLLGGCVLVLVGWAIFTSGLLRDFRVNDVPKVLLGLGFGCGISGWLTMNIIGASGFAWLALWIIWIVLHLVMSTTAAKWCKHGVAREMQNTEGSASATEIYEAQGDEEIIWLEIGLWIFSGIVFPALMGYLPFL